ncbi:Hypothetical predicted protein, partial [Mytilus galloprovincialis]
KTLAKLRETHGHNSVSFKRQFSEDGSATVNSRKSLFPRDEEKEEDSEFNIDTETDTELKVCDLKCPVASFENYISKLCPDLEALWQRPKASFDVGESTWYCKSPLGNNTLAGMMSEISHIALLSMAYTNHSIRATSITVMDVGG